MNVINKAKNSGLASNWMEYKKMRNKVTSLLRAEETSYWQKELEAAYSDKKKLLECTKDHDRKKKN